MATGHFLLCASRRLVEQLNRLGEARLDDALAAIESGHPAVHQAQAGTQAT